MAEKERHENASNEFFTTKRYNDKKMHEGMI